MSFLTKGDFAVIVGAATGIGRAAARKWSEQGVELALFDNSAERLNKLAGELKDKKVTTFVGDVTEEDDLRKFKKEIDGQLNGRQLDLLFLNAGTGGPTTFLESGPIKKLMEINFFGIVNGISAFLEHENASIPKRIVLTGSKQGITNPPGNPGYNASKAALKSYAEGLSYALQGKSHVHLLIPGWTHTFLTGNKTDDAATKPAGAWHPEQVVDQLEAGVERDLFYILCPDNDVTIEMDKKRTQWNTDDIIRDRPALSRWRDSYKNEFAAYME